MSYRRKLGRALSPPQYLTYEMSTSMPDYPYSRSESTSSDEDDDSHSSESESGAHRVPTNEGEHMLDNMEIDLSELEADKVHTSGGGAGGEQSEEERRKRAEKRKGKQREKTAAEKSEARVRKARRALETESYYNAYRPILTVKSAQGFVWNQDLFVPSWQKDRYYCSSSPGSTAVSSLPSSMDFEVECVEIRIREGELDGLIPK